MDIPPIIWISEGLLTEGLVLLERRPKAVIFFALNVGLAVAEGVTSIACFKVKKK